MKRAFLAALALVVLASGCTGGQNQAESTEKEPVLEATVEYTDSGFEPETVVLEQGGVVTWVDNSSKEMWVASDVHPIHSGYDGTALAQHCTGGESDTFDQCSSGDSYSFKFTKEGRWNYHNHEASGDKGTIIVR